MKTMKTMKIVCAVMLGAFALFSMYFVIAMKLEGFPILAVAKKEGEKFNFIQNDPVRDLSQKQSITIDKGEAGVFDHIVVVRTNNKNEKTYELIAPSPIFDNFFPHDKKHAMLQIIKPAIARDHENCSHISKIKCIYYTELDGSRGRTCWCND